MARHIVRCEGLFEPWQRYYLAAVGTASGKLVWYWAPTLRQAKRFTREDAMRVFRRRELVLEAAAAFDLRICRLRRRTPRAEGL